MNLDVDILVAKESEYLWTVTPVTELGRSIVKGPLSVPNSHLLMLCGQAKTAGAKVLEIIVWS